jgi:hypothetical protein
LKIFSKNNNLPEIKKYVSAVIDVLLLLDDDQLNEITNNKTNEYANLVLKSIFSDDHELNEEEIIASDKLMTRFLANDTSL